MLLLNGEIGKRFNGVKEKSESNGRKLFEKFHGNCFGRLSLNRIWR
jgi:hypothetical protein